MNNPVNDKLEDLQEAIVLAGGKFFRRSELLEMKLETLFGIAIPNNIKIDIKFERKRK